MQEFREALWAHSYFQYPSFLFQQHTGKKVELTNITKVRMYEIVLSALCNWLYYQSVANEHAITTAAYQNNDHIIQIGNIAGLV